MTIFTNIILNQLINFIQNQTNELKNLQLNKLIPNPEELNLFHDINIYEKKIDINEWDLITEQANKSIYDEQRINKLNESLNDIDLLATELSKQENFEELNEIEAAIAEEDYKNEEKKQIQQLLNQFYKEEHSEITLPEFYKQEQFINFTATNLMHNYESDNKSHYSFVSDFFPVNNIDISSLIKEVRKSIHQNQITSAINIYKAWLKYLKENNEDYYIYDWNNFNDQGQFIKNNSDKEKLDIYINAEDQILTYDEEKDKREQDKQFQQRVNEILSNGTYKPNFKEIQQLYLNKKTKELYANQ